MNFQQSSKKQITQQFKEITQNNENNLKNSQHQQSMKNKVEYIRVPQPQEQSIQKNKQRSNDYEYIPKQNLYSNQYESNQEDQGYNSQTLLYVRKDNYQNQNQDMFNYSTNTNRIQNINITNQQQYQKKNENPVSNTYYQPSSQQQKNGVQQQQQKIKVQQQNNNHHQYSNNNQQGASYQKKNENSQQQQNGGNQPSNQKQPKIKIPKATWNCSACNQPNQEQNEDACKNCFEYKYRSYDRMSKDCGEGDFNYIFFVDYAVENKEIIEISIQVVDVRTKTITEDFSSFIRPTEQSNLQSKNEFLIQNSQILQDEFKNVSIFLEKYLQQGKKNCAVVYENDIHSFNLYKESQKKNFKLPPMFRKYICMKSVFPSKKTLGYDRVPQSINQMIDTLKMKFQGIKSSAIDRSKNLALVGLDLLQKGYHFSLKQKLKIRHRCNYVKPQDKGQLEQYSQNEIDQANPNMRQNNQITQSNNNQKQTNQGFIYESVQNKNQQQGIIQNNNITSNQNGGTKQKGNKNKDTLLLEQKDRDFFPSEQAKSEESQKWRCRSCKQFNDQESDKNCIFCSDQKFRAFDRMRKSVGKRDYDYLFFVDFECNHTDEDGFEIIEFSLQVVDVKQKEIVDTFSSFVQPSSQIASHISKLTKITHREVQNAPKLSNVLNEISIFLQKYFNAGQERCVVVYESDHESKQLHNEIKKKNIALPQIFSKYINLQSIFPVNIAQDKKVPTNFKKMLEILKMKFLGELYNATDDSKNQALAGIELLNRGYNFSNQQEIKLGEQWSSIDWKTIQQRKEEYQKEYEKIKEFIAKQKEAQQQSKQIAQQNSEGEVQKSVQNIQKENGHDLPNQEESKENKQQKDKKVKQKKKEEEDPFYEEAKWRCRTCNNQNKWKHKACQFCSEFKFREHERMKKDIGNGDYDYLFFVDFECNQAFKDGPEIIEFPLHVIDVKAMQIVESFNSYVRPSSKVTKRITKLTKIEDSQVRSAPKLKEVLENVQYFLQKYLQSGVNRCSVVYDCDSDSTFLFNETKKKKIQVPLIFQKYICLKTIFPADFTTPKKVPTSLSNMLEQLKMKFMGQEHCGTDDAMNQALVAVELLKRGYHFSKNQEIKLGVLSNLISPNTKQRINSEYKQEYINSLDQTNIQNQFQIQNQKEIEIINNQFNNLSIQN